MIGAVAAELQMKPAPSVEHSEFERRLQMAANIKKPVKLLDKVPMNNILNPGTTGAVMKQFLKIAVRAMVLPLSKQLLLISYSHPTKIV